MKTYTTIKSLYFHIVKFVAVWKMLIVTVILRIWFSTQFDSFLLVLTHFDSFLLLTTHFNLFRLIPTINNSFQHIPTSSKTKRVSSSSSIFYSEMWKLLRREEKHQKLLVKPQKQQQQRKHLVVMRWVLSWHSDLLLDWVQSFESSLERGLGPAFSFHFIH